MKVLSRIILARVRFSVGNAGGWGEGASSMPFVTLLLFAALALLVSCRADSRSIYDQDGDGYALGVDCDDQDPTIGPRYTDADGDGFGTGDATDGCEASSSLGFSTVAGDCDDSSADIYPGAVDICDGIDADCNGLGDEENIDMWYLDDDGDGHGDPDQGSVLCSAPEGYVLSSDDCDDTDPERYAGHAEVCDGKDNDCDSLVDGDAYEPNPSLEEAYFLGDLDEENVGTPRISSFQATIGLTDQNEWDTDFFYFSVDDDFVIGDDDFYLNITLSSIPENADYNLYLYWDDPEDNYFEGIQLVGWSEMAGSSDEFIQVKGDSGPDNGGKYYIEVRSVSWYSCSQPYVLTIETDG